MLQYTISRYVKDGLAQNGMSYRELSARSGNCGIALQAMDKNALFPAIIAGGVLPRKTFSMGEAEEKRYYMECRKIV